MHTCDGVAGRFFHPMLSNVPVLTRRQGEGAIFFAPVEKCGIKRKEHLIISPFVFLSPLSPPRVIAFVLFPLLIIPVFSRGRFQGAVQPFRLIRGRVGGSGRREREFLCKQRPTGGKVSKVHSVLTRRTLAPLRPLVFILLLSVQSDGRLGAHALAPHTEANEAINKSCLRHSSALVN